MLNGSGAYPVDGEQVWDMTAFGVVNPATSYRQPVWYRLLRTDKGILNEAHYIDTGAIVN